MTDPPDRSSVTRSERLDRALRQIQRSKRGSLAVFVTIGIMAMCSVIMFAEGFITWAWALPWGATAASVYSHRRVGRSTAASRALLWVTAQAVFGIGAFFLLWFPARMG